MPSMKRSVCHPASRNLSAQNACRRSTGARWIVEASSDSSRRTKYAWVSAGLWLRRMIWRPPGTMQVSRMLLSEGCAGRVHRPACR